MTSTLPPISATVPPLPVKLITAAGVSATALAITTTALTVLLHLYPQMGVVSFATLTTATSLSFVAFVVSVCRLHQKRDVQLALRQPAPSIPPFCPVVTHPHPHAQESTEIETVRAALPGLLAKLDACCLAFIRAHNRSRGCPTSLETIQTVNTAVQNLLDGLNDLLDDEQQMYRLTLAAAIACSFQPNAFVPEWNDPTAFVENLATYCRDPLLQQIQPNVQPPSASNIDYQKLCTQAARYRQAPTDEAAGLLLSAFIALLESIMAQSNAIKACVAQQMPAVLLRFCGTLPQWIEIGLGELQGLYDEGVFERKVVKAALYGATAFQGRAIWMGAPKALRLLPITPTYQRRILDQLIKPLTPLLVNPIYDATVNKVGVVSRSPHPFRVALFEQIVDRDNFVHQPVLPGNTLSDYITLCDTLLDSYTAQFNALTFGT
ncbi:MAG: hypothetical protein S4CHLAM2_10020 [Chlamydiales bacterium]|nr:hypothetical protein [Chlamydiales bacterium]